MRRWLQSLHYRMQTFMYGRYGNDALSAFLSIVTLILLILACFSAFRFLFPFAVFITIWAYYRIMSKKIPARRAELEAYQKCVKEVRSEAALLKLKCRDRKQFRYYRCKGCRKILRVPAGKGRIKIYCRNCGYEFKKKT